MDKLMIAKQKIVILNVVNIACMQKFNTRSYIYRVQ